MSASSILKDALANLLKAFPQSKQPVTLHLRASIGAVGAPTLISTKDASGRIPTTAGVTIARVSAAVYDISWPACRGIALGSLNGSVGSAASGSFVAADPRYLAYDRSTTNTNATTGKLRVCFGNGTAVNTELGNGQEINLAFDVDLG
jgi:hypothetical protein